MNKFLDAYALSKLNQEDINYLSRYITSAEIESAIKSLAKKEHIGPDRFTTTFCETFKELILMFFKLFHKIEREEMYVTKLSL
jgi:hypothetical protein